MFLYNKNCDFWEYTYQFKWRDSARGVCVSSYLTEDDFFTLVSLRKKFSKMEPIDLESVNF